MAPEKKKYMYNTKQKAAEDREQQAAATQSPVSKRIKSSLNLSMKPELWRELPNELFLEIYKKLPLPVFHRLCVVCKDWNQWACEQRSSICEWRVSCNPVSKPYFVVISQGREDYATGILAACNTSLFRWESTKHYQFLDRIGDLYEAFSVQGILFDGSCLEVSPAVATHRYPPGYPPNFFQALYDIHAREHVLVPHVPRLEGSRFRDDLEAAGVLGMIVDTSNRPYSFKLIKGSYNAGTLILDSQKKTWETKPSRLVSGEKRPTRSSSPKCCVHFDGCVYIWSDLYLIHVYSLGEDKWSTLSPPPRHFVALDFRGLGHWESEIYAVSGSTSNLDERVEVTWRDMTLSVWKLTHQANLQKWSEFERMPKNLLTWLLQPYADGSMPLTIVTNHCCEYFLIHALALLGFAPTYLPKKRGRRYVLFNISTKLWSRLEAQLDAN